MPPRSKAAGGFAGLIDSDSDADFDSQRPRTAQMPRTTAMKATGSKPRGRPPMHPNKVTKPAQRTDRAGAAQAPRQALQERSSNMSREAKPAAKNSKPRAYEDDLIASDRSAGWTSPKRVQHKVAKSGTASRGVGDGGHASKAAKGRPPKSTYSVEDEIPEPPPVESMDIDNETEGAYEEDGQQYDEGEAEDQRAENDLEASLEPADIAEHSMDADPGDVSLRRRLGELSKRYESLEARHRDLREVGIKDAERNYDRLKKQSEENAAAANKLISELQAELASQSSLARQHERSELKCDDLQEKVTDLTTSLSEARSEIKTLSTKLAAARSAEANIKVPGSALKANASRNGGPSAEALQAAQAKEDLYGDLTGLIVRGMKHGDKEDVFDCIQTGRNGTLHFKLALDTPDACENYEDVQYSYRPQLDPNRDEELQSILPEYLLEEIEFPRSHASKFFARVTKSLTEKLG